MDALHLSREHTSRLVNLHRRYRVYQDKAIANLAEERLLRIEENGIVEDVLTFLDMVEFPARHEEEGVGAVAGAAEKDEKSKGKGNRWLLSRASLLQPFMSEGEQVPMAFALYYNKKSPTEYNEAMSREMGGFVRNTLQREVSLDLLTKAFHQSDIRGRIILKATSDEDKRLNAKRTPYLLLLDIRNEQRNHEDLPV
jgi:hypothetical protein